MDIDKALREFNMSVGGVHVRVATPFGSQVVYLTVGEQKVEISGMNELLTAIDLLGRVAHTARQVVIDNEEEQR